MSEQSIDAIPTAHQGHEPQNEEFSYFFKKNRSVVIF